MFAYIFSHFFNHALGNISYDAMETWLRYHVWFWRIPVVNDTLYLAAIIHFSLGLWALYQRRHFRYSAAEITQLVLGLSIPLWLAGHLGAERLSGALWAAAVQLRFGALHLLGRSALQYRRTIHVTDGGLDARLYRPLFLAAAEVIFRSGSSDPSRHLHPFAGARHDWRTSWRTRGRSARRGFGLASGQPAADRPCASTAHHSDQPPFIFLSHMAPRSGWYSRRAAYACCANAGAASQRFHIRIGRCVCRRA